MPQRPSLAFLCLTAAVFLVAIEVSGAPIPVRQGMDLYFAPCNGGARQRWNTTALSNLITIPEKGNSENSIAHCLNVWTGSKKPGTPVSLFMCGEFVKSANEQFWLHPNSGQLIVNGSGLCVSASSTQIAMVECTSPAAAHGIKRVGLTYQFVDGEQHAQCLDYGSEYKPYADSAFFESNRWKVTVALNGLNTGDQKITYITDVRIFQDTFGTWTGNLVYAPASVTGHNSQLSTSSISTTDNVWHPASGGYIREATPTSVVIAGIRIGDIASEVWTIQLGADGENFNWSIERTYLRDAQILFTRFATLVLFPTGDTIPYDVPVRYEHQIASMVEPTLQWNVTNASGFVVNIGDSGSKKYPEKWIVAFTNRSTNTMLFSPGDIHLRWTNEGDNSLGDTSSSAPPLYFSFQYPWADNQFETLGVVSSPNKVFTVTNGSAAVTSALSFEVLPGSSYDKATNLILTTGSPRRDILARNMSRVFWMWTGNFLENSADSVECLFELMTTSMVAGIFAPPPPEPGVSDDVLPEMFQSYRYQLEFFLATAVNKTTGRVQAEWNDYFYTPGMTQQQTQLLGAIYFYVLATGDENFIVKHLNTVELALDYILDTMGLEETGVASCPEPITGLPNAKQNDNWMDIINFGGKDGIVNAEAVLVLASFADLYSWLGDEAKGAKFKALHTKAAATYNELFWNEETGLYGDWIDTNNTRRAYGYVWHQSLAVDPRSGIASNNKTRMGLMKQAFDANYERIFRENNVTNETLWCTPTNFVAVPDSDQVVWYQAYGVYENGACFMLQMGWEIAFRFYVGDDATAMNLVDRVLNKYEETRLWGQHFSWLDQEWADGDVLTDANMIIHALVRGGFNIRPTMSSGVIVDGKAAAALEGAKHTFYLLGVPTTVEVKNGVATIVSKD